MSIEELLKQNNIKLPDPKEPVGSYVASRVIGKFLLYQVKFQLMKKVIL